MIEQRDIQPEKKNLVVDDKVDKAIEKEALAAGNVEYVEAIPDGDLEKPGTPKDPRMEIAERREERMNAEREENNPVKTEPVETSGKENNNDLVKNEDQTLIKVGGVERWVDNEKIENAGSVQAYQKEVAVQQGFQDLAKERKLLAKQQDDFIKQQSEFAAKRYQLPAKDVDEETPNLSSPDDLKNKDVAELIKIEHTALVDGEDEVATAAALELHERRGNTIDQSKVVAEVTEQVTRTTEANNRKQVIDDAREAFYEAHPEVKTDPRLLDMVDQETNLVMQNNPELKTPGEILEKSFKNISKWKGDSKSNLNTRHEEKRQLKQPGSSNGRVSSTPEPTHETKSEYVQNLRKSRGLE